MLRVLPCQRRLILHYGFVARTGWSFSGYGAGVERDLFSIRGCIKFLRPLGVLSRRNGMAEMKPYEPDLGNTSVAAHGGLLFMHRMTLGRERKMDEASLDRFCFRPLDFPGRYRKRFISFWRSYEIQATYFLTATLICGCSSCPERRASGVSNRFF